MNTVKSPLSIEQLVEDIDRLIDEMMKLRSQVAALKKTEGQAGQSVREADYFGMWADREDLKDRSSREWLEDLRKEQYHGQSNNR